MKKIFIEDLMNHVNEPIVEVFYIMDLQKNYNRQGNSWISVRLADRTGEVTAKIWSEFEDAVYDSCVGKVCTVTGKVDCFNGVAGIAVVEIVPTAEGEYEPADMAYCLSEDLKSKFLDELDKMISCIKDKPLQALVSAIFKQNGAKMLLLPAGIVNHHAFNGALMVHTLEVTKLALAMADVNNEFCVAKEYAKYPIDRSLLVAGALLHDIGKIVEYRSFPEASRTVRGRLVGHRDEAMNFISCYNAKLPEEQQVKDTAELSHIVLSSHGMSCGVQPVTLEAIIVAQADAASASMDAYHSAFRQFDEKHLGNKSHFAYSNMLDAKMYRREVPGCEEN